MKKIVAAALMFCLFFTVRNARAQLYVDKSNTINKLFSFYAGTAQQLNDYFWNAGFKEKDLPGTKFIIKQYAIPGADDGFLITLLKGEVFATSYKTRNKEQFDAAVAVIKKMGFTPIQAAKPEPNKTVYAKPDSMDRIMTLIAGNATTTVYMIQVNNLTVAAGQMK